MVKFGHLNGSINDVPIKFYGIDPFAILFHKI